MKRMPHSTSNQTGVRPSISKSAHDQATSTATAEEHPLITRRRFLYGAIGAGAVAALGVGAVAYNAAVNGGSDEVAYLKVAQESLKTLNDFTALGSADERVRMIGSFDIPYGTLVWANDEDIAACLLPTESGSPLAQIGLLHLGSGTLETVQEEAIGKDDGFEIYDVRANSAGIVWTEANIMEGTWRIYVSSLSSQATLGTARKVDEGNDSSETPTLAVSGKRAFWQIIPKSTDDAESTSKLMAVSFSSGDATCLYESPRNSASPVYSASDSVCIAPRSTAGAYYQLTNISAESGEVLDTLTLPEGMKPLETGYGQTGFMFSFPDIYDYGGAISNLGTYAPISLPEDGNYSGAQWFGFARTPSAAPAWAGNLLIVKSSYAVCGVDLDEQTYFAIDVENGADTYGEYLASTGTHETFVTYTNIDHTPIGADKIHACRVKVWAPLTSRERTEYDAAQSLEDESTEA